VGDGFVELLVVVEGEGLEGGLLERSHREILGVESPHPVDEQGNSNQKRRPQFS
jgi:hypothetical protein